MKSDLMPEEFHITSIVKKAGPGTCLYLPSIWGLVPAQKLYMTIQECDVDQVPQTVSVTVRRANSTGAVKIAIPKSCGFAVGTWVHVKLMVQ